MQHGYNGGVPIDEAFFRKHISGRHNPEIAAGGWGGRSPVQVWVQGRGSAVQREV